MSDNGRHNDGQVIILIDSPSGSAMISFPLLGHREILEVLKAFTEKRVKHHTSSDVSEWIRLRMPADSNAIPASQKFPLE